MGFSVSNLPPEARAGIFYSVFGVVYLVYLVVVGGLYLGYSSVSGWALETIAQYAPLSLKELSVSNEVVAALLGGVLAWTAPGRPTLKRFFVLLGLSGAAYLMYLHMQVLIGNGTVEQALLSGNTTPNQLPDSLATLTSFATTARSFAAATFGAVIGWNFNQTIPLTKSPAGAVAGAAAAAGPGPQGDPAAAGGAPASGIAAPLAAAQPAAAPLDPATGVPAAPQT